MTVALRNIEWVSGQKHRSEGMYGNIQALINRVEQQNSKQENSPVMLQALPQNEPAGMLSLMGRTHQFFMIIPSSLNNSPNL